MTWNSKDKITFGLEAVLTVILIVILERVVDQSRRLNNLLKKVDVLEVHLVGSTALPDVSDVPIKDRY